MVAGVGCGSKFFVVFTCFALRRELLWQVYLLMGIIQ